MPEDLRSNSFVKAAHDLLAAHEGMNNFYNEPGPTKTLEQMGSAIPIPAFPLCMSAVLSVRLGNYWGHSWDAQPAAQAILKRVSPDRWTYYLTQCLPTDDRILYKLLNEGPANRWSALVQEFGLTNQIDDLKKDLKLMIVESTNPRSPRFRSAVEKTIAALGYSTK